MTPRVTRPIRDLLAAIGLVATPPAIAQPNPSYSLETISRVPTARLAAQLLPPEDAGDVESHDVLDGSMVQFLSGVRFYHRPQPVASDICGRRVQHVSFIWTGTAPPQGAPRHRLVTPDRRIEQTQIALAPSCRLARGQAFAHINYGISQEMAADALRTVAAARTAALAAGELPFSFTCVDELGHGECGADGREALAGLPIESAFLVEADPNRSGWIRLAIGVPGQPIWELRFPGGPAAPSDLVMTWKAPPPF